MTDPDTARALALLAATLGATPVDGGPNRFTTRCPGCGVATEPDPRGHVTYCLPCTVATLPGTFLDNAWRIEAHLGWAAYHRRIERDGPPPLNPKAWLTPLSRRRR